MESCRGTITLEYYEGSTDFSESEGDDSGCPSANNTASCSPCSSGSNIRDPDADAEFKTYDFQHWDLQQEVAEDDDNGNRTFFSDLARNAMNNHFTIVNQEYFDALIHPKGSFPRCPKGDVMEESYFRRRHPGPFLTCCFGHSHECGDEFSKIPVNTKPLPDNNASSRPHHLKEKKAKFYKPCKNCEGNGFTHHRNPAQHYDDYLKNVTYKLHNNHAKVWPQHLADLKHALEDIIDEKSDPDFTGIAEKCQHYRPSTVIVHATELTENLKKKRTVIAKKRTVVAHPASRSNKHSVFNSTPRSHHHQKRISTFLGGGRTTSMKPQTIASTTPKSTQITRSTKLPEKSKVQSIHSSSDSSPTKNTSGTRVTKRYFRPRTTLQRRIKASVTRLIKSRQAQSKISKQFVKKSKPAKESKYIQKVKPNISAKFLRAKSKGKSLHWSSNLISASTTKGRSKGNRRREKPSMKVLKKPISTSEKNSHFPSKPSSRRSSSNSSNDSFTSSSTETQTNKNGSYSKFRDQNGEFDTEKYRQSILKMLAKHSGTGARRERKKQSKRSSPSRASQLYVSLPKIKNMYSNIKPKTLSNIPKLKRKTRSRKSKSKSDELFDFKTISDISLRSKYSNETNLDNRDSYFSVPSLDDVKI